LSHYRTQAVCRVPSTLGKGPFPLGGGFAECDTRQTAHSKKSDGKAIFAKCLFSDTRQSFTVCQYALGKIKQRGRQNKAKRTAKRRLMEALQSARQKGTRQTRWLCRLPDLWHSTKAPSLPSATSLTLRKATTGLKKRKLVDDWLVYIRSKNKLV